MLTVLLGGVVSLVVGVASAFFGWLFGRKKQASEVRNTDADTQKKESDLYIQLATSALERMDRAERKIDEMEGEWNQLRSEIYPHRAWDARAYQTALLVNPDFDPPPALTI